MSKFKFSKHEELAAALLLNAEPKVGIQNNVDVTQISLLEKALSNEVIIRTSIPTDDPENHEELADSEPRILFEAWKELISNNHTNTLPMPAIALGYAESWLGIRAAQNAMFKVGGGAVVMELEKDIVFSVEVDGGIEFEIEVEKNSDFPVVSENDEYRIGLVGVDDDINVSGVIKPENNMMVLDLKADPKEKYDLLIVYGRPSLKMFKSDFIVFYGDFDRRQKPDLTEFSILLKNSQSAGLAMLRPHGRLGDMLRSLTLEINNGAAIHDAVWNTARATGAVPPTIIGDPDKLPKLSPFQNETLVDPSEFDLSKIFSIMERGTTVGTIAGTPDLKDWQLETLGSSGDEELSGDNRDIDVAIIDSGSVATTQRELRVVPYDPFGLPLENETDLVTQTYEKLPKSQRFFPEDVHFLKVLITPELIGYGAAAPVDETIEFQDQDVAELSIRLEPIHGVKCHILNVKEEHNYRNLTVKLTNNANTQSSYDQAKVQTVKIGKTGRSSSALFAVRTQELDGGQCGFDIIVSQGNRTIQHLQFLIGVGAGSDADPVLKLVDEVVALGSRLSDRAAAEIGFHVTSGQDGMTPRLIPNGSDRGILIADVLDLSKNITDSLNAIANNQQEVWTNDNDRRRFIRLAQNGYRLRQLIEECFSGNIASQPHLISVSGRPSDLWVPIEFVYESDPPLNNAKLCEESFQRALDNSCQECPNRTSKHHVCPLKFWGFGGAIERNFQSSGLEPYSSRHLVSRRALYIRHDNAVAGPEGKVGEDTMRQTWDNQAPNPMITAESWSSWREKISSLEPNLGIIMSHTERVYGDLALTVGDFDSDLEYDLDPLEWDAVVMNQTKSANEIKTDDIGKRESIQCIFLLGCHTNNTEAFVGFPEITLEQGADMVIATRSTILGRYAYPIVNMFLDILAQQREVSFAEIISLLRRRSVAQGGPYILSIIGYGSSDWKLEGRNV